jgi:hypothetical protein
MPNCDGCLRKSLCMACMRDHRSPVDTCWSAWFSALYKKLKLISDSAKSRLLLSKSRNARSTSSVSSRLRISPILGTNDARFSPPTSRNRLYERFLDDTNALVIFPELFDQIGDQVLSCRSLCWALSLVLAHLTSTALRAISLLSSGVNLAARILPPFDPPSFPKATAFGFFFLAIDYLEANLPTRVKSTTKFLTYT